MINLLGPLVNDLQLWLMIFILVGWYKWELKHGT